MRPRLLLILTPLALSLAGAPAQTPAPAPARSAPAAPATPAAPAPAVPAPAPAAPAPAAPAASVLPATPPAPRTQAAGATETPAAIPGNQISWSAIGELPPAPGQEKQPGLSGLFAGPVKGGILLAGGTFYAKEGPLEGGQKTYSDTIYVLSEKTTPASDTPEYTWTTAAEKLPHGLSLGVSIPLDDGVLCVGGTDGQRCYADVFLLSWDAKEKKVATTPFPPLPKPLAFHGGARAGQWIFVAGGSDNPGASPGSSEFFGLDLSHRGDPAAFKWEPLPAWTGSGRILPVCAGQNDGQTDCFYLISGRNSFPGQPTTLLTDVQKYSPATKAWTPIGDVTLPGGTPACVMAGTAVALEMNRILVLGGDNGEVMRLLEANARHTASADETETFKRFNQLLLDHHPGYRRDMLLLDTRTNKWSRAGSFPGSTPAVTPAVLWDNAIILPCGETSPGKRSNRIWLGKFEGQ